MVRFFSLQLNWHGQVHTAVETGELVLLIWARVMNATDFMKIIQKTIAQNGTETSGET